MIRGLLLQRDAEEIGDEAGMGQISDAFQVISYRSFVFDSKEQASGTRYSLFHDINLV